MQKVRKVTHNDGRIAEILQDPHFKVTRNGAVFTRRSGQWRPAGWVSRSRNGTKVYRRITYQGIRLYVHRIVFAAFGGKLNSFKTINHKDLNGLNNRIENLELITARENIKHAYGFYKRSGMSAAEARANWIGGLSGR